VLAGAAAAVLIARSGSDGDDSGEAEAPSTQEAPPRDKPKAPTGRRLEQPSRGLWSVFEDHSALIRSGPIQRQATLNEMHGLGADTLRVEIKWNEVAPRPTRQRRPRFDASDPGAYPGFGNYDDLLKRAQALGFRVVADLAPDAPRWATAGGRGYAETANLGVSAQEFGRFAGAVAKRYSGSYRGLPRIGWLSIWNEPNHFLFLKPVESGPDTYRAMVTAALPAIRAAGDARVLLGETAPAGRAGRALGPREFMQRFLCLDSGWQPVSTGACAGFGKLAVDGWAHHPYGPLDTVPAGRDLVNMLAIRRLGSYLDSAARAGRLPRGLPIYDTEFGLQSNPPDPTVSTTLAKQAQELNQKEELHYRYPRLRSYAQYLMWDDPVRPGPRDVAWSGFQTGLRFIDNRAKPAWNAYRLPIVVHRAGGGVRIWGCVRPGSGPRTVRLQVLSRGRWRNAGRSFRTAASGYFVAKRRAVASYRFVARALGTSRAAVPIG
jgi:hypothetical protein